MKFSSLTVLFAGYSSLMISLSLSKPLKSYTWSLANEWKGTNFFDGWDFYSGSDPTHGFVQYVTQSEAESMGLIKTTSTNAYMYADSTQSSSSGRYSVRISSEASYNSGLFILSLNHMPQGCGTWPAWWLCGSDWPNNGEIDIVEGVNSQTHDLTTLHTSDGCDMSSVASELNMTGSWSSGSNGEPAYNCYVDAANQYSNQGCGVASNTANSYGEPFNNNGGGYFVLLFDTSINNVIQMWFFSNSNVPNDLTGDSPSSNPSDWGAPIAEWILGSNCSPSHFNGLNIIFDLTFCGDWAGNVWSSDSECSGKASTCNDFVQNNPSYFADAYWDINFVRVFSYS